MQVVDLGSVSTQPWRLALSLPERSWEVSEAAPEGIQSGGRGSEHIGFELTLPGGS